jgi:hypothetical protein
MIELDRKEAPGFMITMLNGRRFFIETEHWPRIERDGNITLDGENVFELMIAPAGQNQINCTSGRVTKGPWQTTWIEIRGTAIATIEKVSTESFIWQSVFKAKSNLVLPGSPVPNVQEVSQGRQKFRKVK